MFKNKSGKVNPDTTDTLIGVGTVLEGTLKSQAGIRIEGTVVGDIVSSGDVIIGESGRAQSNIAARNLMLGGQLDGNAEVTGKLTICATGVLNGNISVGSLIIEAGGAFNGSSKMAAATKQETSAVKQEKPAS
ncbi:bactofilin family protein [Paenibacillus chungangensis]|uniref:Polymer-forming cytoskeletal protein n=1 Tax=Paenibacillus chungangensis TaxID=696535 RepID=A0ABW3HQB1_9BACL